MHWVNPLGCGFQVQLMKLYECQYLKGQAACMHACCRRCVAMHAEVVYRNVPTKVAGQVGKGFFFFVLFLLSV